jgi:vancomycin resistance protein VanJ
MIRSAKYNGAEPAILRRTIVLRKITGVFCCFYAFFVAAMCLLLRFAGDRSWFGALITFSPRWFFILPAILLFPLAMAFNKRFLWIVIATVIAAVFGVMGFCIPLQNMFNTSAPGQSVRVLTCNTHGQVLETGRLAELIADVHPDVVVLQEWTQAVDSSLFKKGDWTVITNGEMLLVTRFHVESSGEVENAAAVHYIVKTPGGNLDLFNVHFASPHFPLRDVILGKENGRADLEMNIKRRGDESREVVRTAGAITGPVLIAGDFNLCPDSPIFRDNFFDFRDAFVAKGFGFGWTYRNRWTALRIDHILARGWIACRACWLGPDVGSPHRPLIADFSIPTAK